VSLVVLPINIGEELKASWTGKLVSIQPRIRLRRSFDERSHSYLGYVLRISGEVDSQSREIMIAIGKGAQAKHGFRIGDTVTGLSEPVADQRLETAEFYKTSGLEVLERSSETNENGPPWRDLVPDLATYRQRGHRRLSARTYDSKCSDCMWACQMPVELIIDHWNPSRKKYRVETFCYGPKSCSFYSAGPTRKVPGRNDTSWEEEDWVDEQATARRSEDE